MQKTEYPVQP